MHYTAHDVSQLASRYRAHLINGITGYKACHLLATQNETGKSNLAVISSVVHLGADPAMIGFVMRPATVRRDSLENILATKVYSLNCVSEQDWHKAHYTSAKFAANLSEFTACGFEEQRIDDFGAPFVASSAIKIGMSLAETIELPNQTIFIIGNVEHVLVDDSLIKNDGFVDLQQGNIVVSSGLDSYHKPSPLGRLSYAQPSEPPHMIDDLQD